MTYKILVIDDNKVPRELIRDTLKNFKKETREVFHVTEAVDGLEAKSIILKNTFDLVITDLIMPEMNGYELCRWIKSNPSSQNTPVILCSTKGEEFDRYWGMKQGADAYIIKPFKTAELLQTVKYLIKHSKAKS